MTAVDRWRRSAGVGLTAALLAITGTMGAATAQTTHATDPSHDKPAYIDLTRATFTYGDHRYVAKVHVRDLRWRGEFNFNFLIDGDTQAYGGVYVRAHHRTKALSVSTNWQDRGRFESLNCHPKVAFRPGKDYVRVSVRRNCFPMKMDYTQFTVESIGRTKRHLRYDDIDGMAAYN